MAFKIGSIQELQTIAATMTEYADNATAETNKIVTAVDQLDALISGQDVDEALRKINENVKGNAENAVKTLRYIGMFIRSQAAAYSENEISATSALTGVQNALNGIEL